MKSLFLAVIVSWYPWLVPLWPFAEESPFSDNTSSRRDSTLHDPELRWRHQNFHHDRVRFPEATASRKRMEATRFAALPIETWERDGAWRLITWKHEGPDSIASKRDVTSTTGLVDVVRVTRHDRTPSISNRNETRLESEATQDEVAGAPNVSRRVVSKIPEVPPSLPESRTERTMADESTSKDRNASRRGSVDSLKLEPSAEPARVAVIPVTSSSAQDDQKQKAAEDGKVVEDSQDDKQDTETESTEKQSADGSPEQLEEPLVRIDKAVLKIIESVNVPAQRSGLLKQMDKNEGEVVERGALLACIDEAQAELRLEEAKINLDIAKREAGDDINVRFAHKSLAVAQAELARGEELHTGEFKLITETEIDRLRLIVDKTQLEIERAQLELGILEAKVELKANEIQIREDDLSRHQIISPLEGMIVSVERREGEWIKESDTLVRIVRIDRLRVEGLVPAEIASQGLQGNRVELVMSDEDNDGNTYCGEVVFVNPEAVTIANRAHVRVWAEVENTNRRLFPGQNGTLLIYPRTEAAGDDQ